MLFAAAASDHDPRKSRRRRWIRGTSWVVCAAALVSAIWGAWIWTERIAPVRNEMAENWSPSGKNTPLRWKGVRDRMRRGFFWHDDMVRVRSLGDTESIELIMNRLPESGTITGCLMTYPPHAAEALRSLTAHNAGSTAEEWREWWQSNQGRSQTTLIREAFLPLGIDAQKPPTKDQVMKLLVLIGSGRALESPDRPAEEESTQHGALRTNALRILRDYEVKPNLITYADLQRPDGESMLNGLRIYTEFKAQHPVDNGVGVVFGKSAKDINFDYRDDPAYMDSASGFLRGRHTPWVWFSGIAILTAGALWGARILWRSKPSTDIVMGA